MLSTQPNPLFSVAEIGVLNCPGCGNPMRLARIEPDKPGFDLRIFECPKCRTGESFLVAIYVGFVWCFRHMLRMMAFSTPRRLLSGARVAI